MRRHTAGGSSARSSLRGRVLHDGQANGDGSCRHRALLTSLAGDALYAGGPYRIHLARPRCGSQSREADDLRPRDQILRARYHELESRQRGRIAVTRKGNSWSSQSLPGSRCIDNNDCARLPTGHEKPRRRSQTPPGWDQHGKANE